ncbi:ATP-binding cassette domain-containing protein [Ahrensia kielensis]|uniref:ATP-binding cassette domain-containing protein n=1 Tax=Ahrensia kielensis TaxID=76980 RepID=UPI000A014BFD|nr:ATP-binding cassette domain-containing protein [Ahrensia kielensis]
MLNITPSHTQTAKPKRATQDAQASPFLSCRGLCFSANSNVLIKDISLNFSAHGMSAIMGFNGAGKSLLLRLLHGVIQPDSGTVLWDNTPVTHDNRKRQSMVFQKPVLLRRSVLDNLLFVLKSRGSNDPNIAFSLLEKVGLENVSSRAARLLSGGEQQRLALARGLATKPEILFLDEATSSLDPTSIAIIENILHEECLKGTKVIFASHDIGQIKRLASEVIFINHGRISEQTGAASFFTKPETRIAQTYLDGGLPVI